MENKIKTKIKKVNEILKAGEPGNITEDSSRGVSLTGYNPQYVIDSMNVVFGVKDWGFEDLDNKIDKKETEAIAKVAVWVRGEKGHLHTRTAYGGKFIFYKAGKRLTSFGDAKKSAQTDAIKKALSYFSIGNRAYHGRLKI